MLVELLEALQETGLLLPTVLLLGLIIGSFLNVVIYRLPRHMDQEMEQACLERADPNAEAQVVSGNRWFGLYYLINPPSSCPHCQHRIRARENIPLLSYLIQKGKCSECSAPISIQYPVVELLTGLISVAVVWHFGATPQALAALVLTWTLIALSVIDLQHQILPDVLVLPLLWLGLILNLNSLFTDIHASVYGAVAGYLSLWLLFHVFLLITGKEGMGYGDFKLFALFGAWLGWQMLPQILLLSALVGAISGLGMILFMGKDKAVPIPFGPYLAAAGWIALLWGDKINQAYLQFARIG